MQIKYARAKVKNHIQKRGSESCFNVTESMILFWFRYLNAAVFNNKLPTPDVISIFPYTERGTTLGFCISQGRRISLSLCEEYDDRKTFLTILVHELVHMHQVLFRTKVPYATRMSHGKTFYEWKDRIKRTVGLPLEEYY